MKRQSRKQTPAERSDLNFLFLKNEMDETVRNRLEEMQQRIKRNTERRMKRECVSE
jgi:Spy/CpxP family protein refolding chaperone